MKHVILLSSFLFILFTSCDKDDPADPSDSLNCQEYWSEVNFTGFCGLTKANFDFNSLAADICNAEQNDTYTFDDLVSIRVYNHFMNNYAKEEFDGEVAFYSAETGFSMLSNVGDEAFGVITTGFGKLENATILVRKGTFTIGLFVNGNIGDGSNNCFDESSVVEFARALAAPL